MTTGRAGARRRATAQGWSTGELRDRSATPAARCLQLQLTAGNRAVTTLLGSHAVVQRDSPPGEQAPPVVSARLPSVLTGSKPSQLLLKANPQAFAALIEELALPEPFPAADVRGARPGAPAQPFRLRRTMVRVGRDGQLAVVGVLLAPTGYPTHLGDPTAVDIHLTVTPGLEQTSAQLEAKTLGGLAKADVTAELDLAQAQRQALGVLRGAGVSARDAAALVALARKASLGGLTRADVNRAVLQAIATVAGIPHKERLARQIAQAAFATPVELEAHYSLLGLHRWEGGNAFLRAVGTLVSHVLGGSVHVSATSLQPTGSTGSLPFAHVLTAYGLTWQTATDRYPLGAPMLGARHARHGTSTGVDVAAGAALRRISTAAVSTGDIGGVFEVDLQAQAKVMRRLPDGNLLSFSIRGFVPLNEPTAAPATDPLAQLAGLRAERAEELSGRAPATLGNLPQPLGASVTGSLAITF